MKILSVNNNPPPPREIKALVSASGLIVYLAKETKSLQVLEDGVSRAYAGTATTLEEIYELRPSLRPVYEGGSIEVQF